MCVGLLSYCGKKVDIIVLFMWNFFVFVFMVFIVLVLFVIGMCLLVVEMNFVVIV